MLSHGRSPARQRTCACGSDTLDRSSETPSPESGTVAECEVARLVRKILRPWLEPWYVLIRLVAHRRDGIAARLEARGDCEVEGRREELRSNQRRPRPLQEI